MPHNSRGTGHPQIPNQYSSNLLINEDKEKSREKKNDSTLHRDKPGYQLHLWTVGKLVLRKYGTRIIPEDKQRITRYHAISVSSRDPYM